MILESEFFYWVFRLVKEYYNLILAGIARTLLLAVVGTVCGFIFALIFASIYTMKINKNDKKIFKILKYLGKKIVLIYVTIFRGTPMIVQATIFFNLFPLLGIRMDPIAAGLITVSLNTTAYLTEVLRSGIESIDQGQVEGARSIGLSSIQSSIYIIYPQAIKNSMASIGNEFIVNIKDTAVLSVIGVIELYNATASAGSIYYKILEQMFIAAVIYLFLTYTSSKLLKLLEKKIGAPTKEIVSCN